MALLSALLGEKNPLSQWAGRNSNALTAIGSSLLSRGMDFSQVPAAAAMDKDRLAQAEEQNRTRGWLVQAFPDIAQQLDAGMPVAQAYDLALQRMQPKAPTDPTSTAVGRQQLAAQYGLTGPDATSYILTGKLPEAAKPVSSYDPAKAFDYESGLAKEYRGGADVKSYQDVRNAYERVRTSASQDNGAGDIGLIYGYMKMLDPGSVVREGEFATAETASGVPANILNLYNKLINGERLNPDQRKMFVEAASGLYQQAAGNLSTYNDQFKPRLNAWQVDPGRVLVMPESYDTGAPPPSAMPAGPPAAPSAADPLGIL